MSQQLNSLKKIALLATGDEIIQGDILNSNSQQIAMRLTQHNIPVGMHATCSDNINNIEHAMDFLLKSHSALIITGGLGPTSDDLTRYALSKAIKRPLIFDDACWEGICQRLHRFGYPTPPESNRQQALFPEGATIIPNQNGTAAGCMIDIGNQSIFMLPGPPGECLPMIDSVVLPTLLQKNYQEIVHRKRWLLFGVSEGKIAEELDDIVQSYDCMTGYRLCYPYLEFKLHSKNAQQLAEVVPLIEKTLKPYLAGDGQEPTSEQLKVLLENFKGTLGIHDLATGGLLEYTLKTSHTYPHLLFSTHLTDFQNDMPYLHISGLDEFWHETKEAFTRIEATFHFQGHTNNLHAVIPLRGERVKSYAVEWVCWQLLIIFNESLR